MLLINETFSFNEISVPPLGYNLFYEAHSKILFTDGFWGIYSLNLKDGDVENIVERHKWVESIHSFDHDILLIYSDTMSCIENISVLHDGNQEEVIYSLPAQKGGFCYPAVDPLNKKIALIETESSVDRVKKIVKNIRSNLVIMNITSRSKKSVIKLNMPMPVFAWDNSGDRLYYFNKVNGESSFYVWDEKKGENSILKDVRDISILYLIPGLISERYVIFFGEDDNKTQLIGKLDINSLQIDLKEIASQDYSIMVPNSFTPDNRFILQKVSRVSKNRENKVYTCDINLNTTLILEDTSESLIPIGYNKVLDGLVFFRNQREIISIKLNDPSKQKVLYALPPKKP